MAEDFVKSVAVEKHPTTKNTNYYERQFTEGDSEVSQTPPFHVELLKRTKDVKNPPSPHMRHMQKSTVRPLIAHVKILSISWVTMY